MITPKMRENAHKFVFLMEQYPEHNVNQLIGLLEMPAVEMNNAIWTAIELGFITKPDPETKYATIKEKPKKWEFGDKVEELKAQIQYAFEQLTKDETDLEENYLSQWTQGYTGTDVMIATKLLLNSRVLASYDLEDGENVYTFFTLYKNRDKLWGKKQFKKEPVTAEKAEEPEAPTAPAE